MGSSSLGKRSSSSSDPPEAKDAKEVAKKLIRTGALANIQKSVQVSPTFLFKYSRLYNFFYFFRNASSKKNQPVSNDLKG